jgi:hypothetical protein
LIERAFCFYGGERRMTWLSFIVSCFATFKLVDIARHSEMGEWHSKLAVKFSASKNMFISFAGRGMACPFCLACRIGIYVSFVLIHPWTGDLIAWIEVPVFGLAAASVAGIINDLYYKYNRFNDLEEPKKPVNLG